MMKKRKESENDLSLWRVAFSAKWMAALAAALAVAGVFVALSGWQWGRSARTDVLPERYAKQSLDSVVPLTQVVAPGEPVSSDKADQMVSVRGVYETYQAVVEKRLQDGRDGYWIVGVLKTDGRALLPVVRAWVRSVADIPGPPSGRQEIVGRLLPSEMPEPYLGDRPESGAAGSYGNVPFVKSFSTAQLFNLWLPYENDDDTYAAAVASATVSAENHADSSDVVKAVTLVPRQEIPFNWLNVFYALEWAVFAGFAIFLWWRLVRDDYERRREVLQAFTPDEGHRKVE